MATLHACLLSSSSHGCARAGLAGALALLKDRGELTEQVEWAGRTTDIIAAQRLVQARCCCLLVSLPQASSSLFWA
jgi:hypothetical protein